VPGHGGQAPPTTKQVYDPAGEPTGVSNPNVRDYVADRLDRTSSTRPRRAVGRTDLDPQWQSLLADPCDCTRIIGHGTMVVPRLGFARTEDPAF
jgi:hypothetical protein